MPTSNILILLLSLIHCFFSLEAVDGGDTLFVNQTLSSNNTLVSKRGIFELGFFKPGSSLKEYVGVWYKKSKNLTVIWVANRELPVVKTPGKLTLLENGVLEISDRENVIIWSSNSDESVLNPEAQLLDSGNFVVRDKNQNALDAFPTFLWQGFDYPCDTRFPEMKIGYDKRKKRNVYLSSWKSLDDPAEGDYIFEIDITGIPQYFLKKDSQEVFRTGPWNGETFSGTPVNLNSCYRLSYTSDDEWIYFILEPTNSPVFSETVLGVNGDWLLLIGNDDTLVVNMTLTYSNKEDSWKQWTRL